MAYAMELSGRKYQKSMSNNLLLNESVATGPSSFAKKQLELMGWKEGEGLGKNKQGLSTHVKVLKRKEEEGLGHDENKNAKLMYEDQWWNSSLNATLAKFQSNKKQKKKQKKEQQQSIITTDEQLFVATGGARFGMRAQYRAEGKWARTEKKEELIVLEQKAQESMEWNGLGNAKVVLTSSTSSSSKQVQEKKRRKNSLQLIECSYSNDETTTISSNNVGHENNTPLPSKQVSSTSSSSMRIKVFSDESLDAPETSSKGTVDEQEVLEKEREKRKKSKKKEKKRKRSKSQDQ
mmetsp:Transcript_58/g.107  ORF Transcript_58/g.107 Transcript_58/m.107 type:complete len:292 (-) Transcript_58:135-1010(-)